jgi:ABC-2 type transport system permease protein
MNKIIAIYRREFLYFFNSPTAYVVIAVFLLLSGYFFYNLLAWFNLVSIQAMQNPAKISNLSVTASVVQPLFGNLSVLMLLILPMLTMRLLSEERRSGTAEILFTCPVSDWDVVLGKYLATVTVFAVMLAMTAVYPALLNKYTTPEIGPIVGGYIGLFLLGVSFIAMGTFFSSLSDNQLIAGVITFACGLLFLLIGWLVPFVSSTTASVLDELSIVGHLANFSKGLIDTDDIVFYLNFTAFFLFLSVRVLDSNRWRS